MQTKRISTARLKISSTKFWSKIRASSLQIISEIVNHEMNATLEKNRNLWNLSTRFSHIFAHHAYSKAMTVVYIDFALKIVLFSKFREQKQ